MASSTDFLTEMSWRGLLHQCTAEPALKQHLTEAAPGSGRLAYVGFDPTADSLTIGNLVGIIALGRWQRAGHTPVVVMGGGTGLIGDPSGKSAERTLQTPEQVAANVRSIQRIFERVLDFSPSRPNRAVMTNNADWLGAISYLDALRDIGKHFSVNMMIQKDSVRERLNNREQGISYTEFSYMILQSYDFLHLYRDMGVSVQMGGSDQWGNIIGGCDLIRRCVQHTAGAAAESYGLTWPLVTKADGGKFGKTESGAIWLTAERTSPFQFYQFWLNAADADVFRFLRTFTFLPREQIEHLEQTHSADPGRREAQRTLARHMTELLHGTDELRKVEDAARALFTKSGGDGPFIVTDELLAGAPSSTHDRALLGGTGMALVDLLPLTTLVKSKTEARTQLAQNAVSVNGHAAAVDARVTDASLVSGNIIALRRGKKTWHITRWE